MKSKYPKLIQSDIKLTVGLLVSNHKQYIRRVMEALKPLLAAVPSELVVIDTVGENTDGSIEIVREYTDKIFPFVWCNDFSAARNFCMSKAKGEWFLYQDDDEWFDDVQELIDFFQTGECEAYYSGYYYTRDYLPGGGYSMGIAGRMIRRTETTRFVGRVHEHFEETFAPNKEFSCFTHHYGYVYADEAEKAAKQKRNVDILSMEIKECGLTPGRAAQMTQELLGRKETEEEGLRYIEECLTLFSEEEMSDACCQWMLTALVRFSSNRKEWTSVLEQTVFLQENYFLSTIARMVLATFAVPAAIELSEYEIAVIYGECYLNGWDYKKTHPDEVLQQINLDFPRFLTDIKYYNMILMSATAANALGDYRRAYGYFKRLPFGQPGFDGVPYVQEMQKTIDGLKRMSEK